jgi:hypothetical protein
MSSLVRCVLITTRRDGGELAQQLPCDNLPHLEIIHSEYEHLAQWFTLDRSSPNPPSEFQQNERLQQPVSTEQAEVAAP